MTMCAAGIGRDLAGVVARALVVAGLPLAMASCGQSDAPAPTSTGETGQNVVLIVSDGIRWEDLFRGADPVLIDPANGGVRDTAALREAFVRTSTAESRQALF